MEIPITVKHIPHMGENRAKQRRSHQQQLSCSIKIRQMLRGQLKLWRPAASNKSRINKLAGG